tara:strand:+ start:137 stop:586 length:450 start_codon:yes stop_codon:yes gene_type:complete
MKKKILVMGLPGAGKTTLASKLKSLLDAKWLNADEIRKKFNDWDFSSEGRIRQAQRMSNLADEFVKDGFFVIADFICPTKKAREIYKPQFIIWLDTIDRGRFDDTNQIFVNPEKYDLRVTTKDAEKWAKKAFKMIKDNTKIKTSTIECH